MLTFRCEFNAGTVGEVEFAEPAKQVLDARNVMARVMGKPEREMEIEEYDDSEGED